jgi:hypothetical protein
LPSQAKAAVNIRIEGELSRERDELGTGKSRRQRFQILVPVAAAWPRSDVASPGLGRDRPDALGIDIALPIVVGRGDEADMAARCDPVKRLVGCGRYGVKLAPETKHCPNRRTDS